MQPVEKNLLESLDDSLSRFSTPIDGDDNCGKDLRLDPRFIELRDLVSGRNQSKGSGIDWESIQVIAEGLLEKRSKDLRIASYLATSYARTLGVQGIAKGLRLLSHLTVTYSSTVYPRPKQGRPPTAQVNAIQWFVNEATKDLERREQPKNPANIALAQTALAELQSQCGTQYESRGPVFARLRDSLQDLASVSSRADSESSEQLAQSSNSEQKPRAQSPAPHRTAETGASFSEQLSDLRVRAHELRQADYTDPMSYRLIRQALWLQISKLPPTDASGKIQVARLSDLERKTLADHQAAKRWRGLLETSEQLLAKHVLCLDLHRTTCEALRELGSSSTAIRAVKLELRSLLTYFPELPEIKSMQGEPLASQETRAWISSEVLERRLVASTPNASMKVEDQTWWQDVSANARGDEPAPALRHLKLGLSQAPDRLTYARWALDAAQHLQAIEGAPALLASIARSILKEPSVTPVCQQIEREALGILLSARSTLQAKGRSSPLIPDSAELSLDLAQIDFVAARELLQKSLQT